MANRLSVIGERRLLTQHRKTLLTPAELRSGADTRRRGWIRVTTHMAVVLALLCLAAANIHLRSTWSEMEDGVLWSKTVEGLVVAKEVAEDSPAARAGIQPHDELY